MACKRCNAELIPAGPRQHEGHFSVRFHDWNIRIQKLSRDGWQEIRDCYEVDVIAEKAWRFEQPLRYCECGLVRAAAYIDHGKFAVSGASDA